MIKLTLPPKPEKLAQEEAALTKEFIDSGKTKTVWKKDYITQPLLEMSHSKCAYSEIKLNQESTYMEVEHFKHKNQYPKDVVNWNNLLPSCKKCNTTKGHLDVVACPIVNPVFDNPRDHLFVCAFRFYGKDIKGENTKDAVALNDNDHFVVPRFKSAMKIVSSLEQSFELLIKADTPVKSAHQVSALKSIFESCGPHSEYSAVIATHLLYEWPNYGKVRKYLEDNDYWDDEFDYLIKVLESIALPR